LIFILCECVSIHLIVPRQPELLVGWLVGLIDCFTDTRHYFYARESVTEEYDSIHSIRIMDVSGNEGGSMSLSTGAMKKLVKDIRELKETKVDGVTVTVHEDSLKDIDVEYTGPEGTPYEGGVFRMRLRIGHDYPHAPPTGRFLTKIFHPNVSTQGDVCVNVLKRDWKPDMGLLHIITVIRCLLVEPNAESALNEEAGKLLLEGFDEFAVKAKMMTEIHAMSRVKGGPLTDVMNDGLHGDGSEDGAAAKYNTSGAGVKKVSGNSRAMDLKKKKSSLRRL
jgi:ubiquitin-conjugating enzyme E2 S